MREEKLGVLEWWVKKKLLTTKAMTINNNFKKSSYKHTCRTIEIT